MTEKSTLDVALEAFSLKLTARLIRARGITLIAANIDGKTADEVQRYLDVVAEKVADSLDERAAEMLRG